MKANILKKHWHELLNDLKERWPDLTQSDIDYISGDARKLLEIVQKRRHISTAAAQNDIDDFFGRLNIDKGAA
jgi:hypothetical protein